AECPDRAVAPSGGQVERIINGSGSVRVDAQEFSQEVRQYLRVCAVAVVSNAGIKLAIGPKVKSAAVVLVGIAEVVQVQQHQFAARHGNVAVRGEAADAVVSWCVSDSIIKVNEVVCLESRVEGDSEQASLTDVRSVHGYA